MGGETTTWVSSPVPSLLGNGLWWAHNWSGQAKKKKGEGDVHAFILGRVRLEIFPFLLAGRQVHEGT